MADDLEGLARKMDELAARITGKAEIALKRAALVADRLLVFETPVDTGRARGGWQLNLNVPINVSELNQKDKVGARTFAKHVATVARFTLGNVIFISNFVPYIVFLNDPGTSPQAPRFFVQKAVLEAVAFLKRVKFTE